MNGYGRSPQENYDNTYVNNGWSTRNGMRPGKYEIITWFKQFTGAFEVDLVDDTSENVARHVCIGGTGVELLQKRVYNLQLDNGEIIPLEYYQCMKCGKVILNRNFM